MPLNQFSCSFIFLIATLTVVLILPSNIATAQRSNNQRSNSQESLPKRLANPATSNQDRPGPDDDPVPAKGRRTPAQKKQKKPAKPKRPKIVGPAARGIVFIDNDEDGFYSENDTAAGGIKVSNGVDIVTTDEFGAYEIGLQDDQILFVIKPNGLRTAMGKNNLPKFYYIHKPNGSPKLRYPGSLKTGPIPRSIDFPLYQQEEPENFQVLIFGDPQPRNQKEINYITKDVIAELVGNGSSFGVSLGAVSYTHLTLPTICSV